MYGQFDFHTHFVHADRHGFGMFQNLYIVLVNQQLHCVIGQTCERAEFLVLRARQEVRHRNASLFDHRVLQYVIQDTGIRLAAETYSRCSWSFALPAQHPRRYAAGTLQTCRWSKRYAGC